jgi:cell division protein FtsQ
MTELVVSESLKTRRSQLHRQRRLKAWQGAWRFFCLAGLVGTLVWVMSWPEWTIRGRSQITVAGNKHLSKTTVYDLIPLRFPQSIWQLSTQKLGQEMARNPVLAEVNVSRQLLPAQLTIYVTERQAVAQAKQGQEMGYLDATGVFMPRRLYTRSQPQLNSQILFLGYEPQYQSFWRAHYPLLSNSPVRITIINGTDPSNLTLKTELGTVYLGSDGSQFPQQLQVLARLKNLPARVPSHRVSYIDLSNPQLPSLRLAPAVTDKVKKS